MGHGERLMLAREPAPRFPYASGCVLRTTTPLSLDGVLGRAEMMRYLMALQQIARLVDRYGLPGEGAP